MATRTVAEVSDPYANFMRNTLAPQEGICVTCLTFIESAYQRCYRCENRLRYADAVLPISYSEHLSQLHHELRSYKDSRSEDVRRKFQLGLSAVLWRYLDQHETCLAEQVGTDAFDFVTIVPSSSAERDEAHPLHHMVGSIIGATSERYARLLRRSGAEVLERLTDPVKYAAERDLTGSSILLVDDTWASGANAESAAGALKNAGAARVGVIVIGRHVQPGYTTGGVTNAERLRGLPRPFDWDACPYH